MLFIKYIILYYIILYEGDFYASFILHAVSPNQAMIFNKDCYRFFSDCLLLSGNEINNEYDIYSKNNTQQNQ